MPSFRLRIFFTHLLLTMALLGVILGLGYLGWYAWPAWYLLEAERVVMPWVASVLLLGPFASLLVASPAKPAHLLRMNLVVITLLQLGALGGGAWTLWQARPLFYVLTIDRIELVTAADFASTERGELQGMTFEYPYARSPQVAWVWAPLPESIEEKESIIFSAIVEGKDITQMPGYFRPWNAGLDDLRRQLHPMSELALVLKSGENQIQSLAITLGYDEAELGWLRLDGSQRGGVMIFHRLSGEPLRFVAQK